MKKRTLSRDTIKYIAMFTMFLNHFNTAILNHNSPFSLVLEYIGYFTAVTMCYFLVEGYHYTHSKKKYALRMLVFAVISQIPYLMALEYMQFNMLFTLLLCMGVLWVLENVQIAWQRYLGVIALIICSMFFDWGILAPIFTWMFARSRGDREGNIRAYMIAAAMFAYLNFTSYVLTETLGKAVLMALCSSLGIVASGILILGFYDGKKLQKKSAISKWFFYIFYPAHLLVLGVIRMYNM